MCLQPHVGSRGRKSDIISRGYRTPRVILQCGGTCEDLATLQKEAKYIHGKHNWQSLDLKAFSVSSLACSAG